MNEATLIHQLNDALQVETRSWVIAALRHDTSIWESLKSAELIQRILARDASNPASWTPAALALHALDTPLTTTDLQSDINYPLNQSLRRKAAKIFESLSDAIKLPFDEGDGNIHTGTGQLAQAGLLAFALRERRKLIGSWDGLSNELLRLPRADTHPDIVYTIWRTPLACLYGMVPDPGDVLKSIVMSSARSELVAVALSVLLSNPIEPSQLLIETNTFIALLDPVSQSIALRYLQTHRPNLAQEIARYILNEQVAINSEHTTTPIPDGELRAINRLVHLSDIQRIAGDAPAALSSLTTAWDTSRRIQADLAVRAAIVRSQDGDRDASLRTWKEAVELEPDNPTIRANLIMEIIDAGKPAEAAPWLTEQMVNGSDSSQQDHPALLLTSARLASRSGNVDQARSQAIQLLNMLEDTRNESVSFFKTPISPSIAAEHILPIEQLARLLLELDLPLESARAAKIALSTHTNEQRILVLLGQALAASDNPTEAAEYLHIAVALQPDQLELHSQLAEYLETGDNWRSALPEREWLVEKLREILAGKSEAESQTSLVMLGYALRTLANCALHADLPQKAMAACQEALALDEEDGSAHVITGKTFQYLSDYPSAQEHFEKATELSPHSTEAWLSLVEVLGIIGQSNKALETLRYAAQALPDSTDIYLTLGEAYLNDWQGRGHPALTQALAAFQHAVDLTPENIQSRLRLGETQLRLGHLPEARQVLESAYQEVPGNAELAYAYAQCLLALEDTLSAVTPLASVADNIIRSKSTEITPLLEYARTLLVTGQKPAEAIRAVQYIREIEPDHVESLGLLAEALAASGDHSTAMQAYQKALETDLVNDHLWSTRLSLGLGKTALALDRTEIAIAALDEALQADPQNPVVLRALAEAYDAAGLVENALETARAALRAAPDSIDTLVWFADQITGWAEKVSNASTMGPVPNKLLPIPTSQLFTEAVISLNRAIQLAPERVDLVVRLGIVYQKSRDTQAALSAFHRVIQSDLATPYDLHQAAMHLLSLADPQNAVAGLEKALHTCAGEKGDDQLNVVEKAGIAYTLIEAYRQAGNPQAALTSLEQAISYCPTDLSLYRLKADVLMELKRYQEALECLESTITENPEARDILDLRYHAALIQRTSGNLATALSQAEHMLNASNTLSRDPHYLATRVLAADISRSLLLNEKSQAYLGVLPSLDASKSPLDMAKSLQSSGDISVVHYFFYFFLKAELALDRKEELNASQVIELVTHLVSLSATRELYQRHDRFCLRPPLTLLKSRIKALQSRLYSLRGDDEAAMDTLQEAAKALEQVTGQHEGTHLHDQPQNIEDPLSKLMLASTIGALADAAIDLEQWDTALYLIKQAIDIIPHEPLPQLKLAQTLVLRAEAQCTCQSLEVVNHCPGAVALAKHTRQAFEQAIDAADQHINHFIGMLEASQRKDGHDEVNTSSNERLPTQVARVEVARWRARGEAVFNPGPQSAKALSATISLLHPTPEDIAAQIAVFTQIEQGSEQSIPGSNDLNNTHDEGNLRASPLTMAIRAAQTYAQHPGVLMQLSLAFLARPQSQMDALEVAVKAANYIAPNPMMAQEKQDVDSARQTDAPDHPISQHRQNQQALSHYLIARTAHAADNPDIALPAIQAALQNWPDEPRWQARAADIYRLMGDNSSAIPYLSEAARLEPDYAPAHLALGQAYLSLSKRNSGLAGEAVRALERACDLDPEQPSSWMSLADAYRLAGDLNKASSCAERAIALAPDQVPPLLLRAEIALQAGNPQEAHAQVLAALHLQELHQAPLANHSIEDPSLVLLLARTLDQLDRHDEAISALELALPQAHDPLPLLLERVELLKRSKGADNAMQALQEIASEYPDEPSVLYHLAFAHQETGNNEAAVRSAQRALQLALPSESGEHQPPRLSVDDKTALHYLLGREFRLSGQLDQSVHHLNESIRLSPNLLEAYLELGGALQDRRELDQALQVYQQAIQVTPNDPRPYFQAGMALKECKDYQSAETMLRRAVALAPNELSIHRQLGAVVALNLVHNRRKANVET